MKDHAKNVAFLTKEEQTECLVESFKYTIISDFHRLSERIGREAALKWIKENLTELPF